MNRLPFAFVAGWCVGGTVAVGYLFWWYCR